MAIRKIVSRSIGVDVIAAEDLANNSITVAEISNGAVTTAKLDSGAVTADKLASNSVTTAKLDSAGISATFATGAVGTPSITTAGDTNTGIFFPAADTIAFSEGGAEAMRIDSSGNVGIGTTDTNLFNSVGGSTRLAVCGSSASTDILGNTGASISIINTDTTANNTAGLHFARADTDDTPNYAGASIVAQFTDTQVTGQYPKGLLAFLTSTTANAAPSEKMRIDSSGRVTTPYQPAFIAYPTATASASTVQFNATILNTGNNYNTGTYTYTAPVAGLHFFSLVVSYDGGGTNPNQGYISLYVNGNRIRDFFEANPAWSINTELSVSCIQYLNAGDAVNIFSSASVAVQGGNNAAFYSRFSGYLIG